ncbi:MAG: restriction endonuclease subunit S, partial [Clostridia bacterium]|nr:restriction endonuclease subunit S [Clostridia bacterium]
MSKIEELIEKLCPNGVEYKPLWALTAWDKRFNGVGRSMQQKVISYKYYLSADFDEVEREDGDILYLSTGTSDKKRYTKEELAGDYLAEGEVVCIPWGGTPNVKYHKGKFVTGDNRIATSLDKNILDNKYLYYAMQNRIKDIASFYRGAGIQHPHMLSVLMLEIPVPPVEIQCEIVKILDNFAELTAELKAELTAELTARKKQYEYYRDKLLTFSNDNNKIEFLPLRDVIISLNTGLNPRQFFQLNTPDAKNYYVTIREMRNGTIVFTDSTDRINDEALKLCNKRSNLEVGDVLFSGTGTIGETVVIENEPINWNIKEGVYTIKPNKEKILSKFLHFIIHSSLISNDYMKKAAGGTVKSVKMEDMKNLVIPVPSLEVQERIVNVLDNFDAICSDLKIGLPAEIEARKKQYEYY